MEKIEKEMICAKCGFIGQAENFSKGNDCLEIFMWILLFVPGAMYSAWRAFNEFKACPQCMNKEMTPVDSSFGKKILHEKQRINSAISKEEQLEIISKIMKNI